jgi:hypothetical protein
MGLPRINVNNKVGIERQRTEVQTLDNALQSPFPKAS